VIRAVLVVAWLGLLVLATTIVTGYQMSDEPQAQRHMTLALFAVAALLFADLCVLVYVLLTRRLVRRTVEERGMEPTWLVEQARSSRRAAWPAALAGLLLTATFGVGFPTYTASWPPLAHHLLAIAAALAQLVFLWLAGGAVTAGERHLAALGREVEGVRYTPPLEAAPPAPPPAQQP
jgi:hypothetical protein